MTRFAKDMLERALWTGAQAGLAVLSVEALGLPEWAILPAGAILAAVKALVAKHVGSPESASTIPSI